MRDGLVRHIGRDRRETGSEHRAAKLRRRCNARQRATRRLDPRPSRDRRENWTAPYPSAPRRQGCRHVLARYRRRPPQRLDRRGTAQRPRAARYRLRRDCTAPPAPPPAADTGRATRGMLAANRCKPRAHQADRRPRAPTAPSPGHVQAVRTGVPLRMCRMKPRRASIAPAVAGS